MGICHKCGREGRTYSFEGGELCRQCLLDVIGEPDVVAEYLPGFMEARKEDFVSWICDLSGGDPYGVGDYVNASLSKAVQLWKRVHPDLYKEAAEDFRTSQPSEWEEYMGEIA